MKTRSGNKTTKTAAPKTKAPRKAKSKAELADDAKVTGKGPKAHLSEAGRFDRSPAARLARFDQEQIPSLVAKYERIASDAEKHADKATQKAASSRVKKLQALV